MLECPKTREKIIHKFFWFGNMMTVRSPILYSCDVCATHNSSTKYHQLVQKLYQMLNEGNARQCQRSSSCHECFISVEYLLNNITQKLFVIHGNMQKDLHDEDDVSNKPPSEQLHLYNCDCTDCQLKYGSLPLLVQVIEGREKLKVTSSTANLDLSQPSTSSETNNSNTPSSHKNTMTCPHCSKEFTHRGDLNKHVRKHTGEQPFACPVCRRKFAHTSNLNRHLKVHSGDRPFACDVCNKHFSRKDKLSMHKKTKLCKKFTESAL